MQNPITMSGDDDLKAQELERINTRFREKLTHQFGKDIALVFGDGNPEAEIVLVGEAPGRQELQQGKPFVGQAGKNLDEFIQVLGIKREDLYITNTVKFRPVKINSDTGREANRAPTREEVRIFTEFIGIELEVLAPKLVVSLGNTALRCILKDDKASIGLLHGSPVDVTYLNSKFVLFPLYHPASIIYNRELKSVYMDDLYKLKDYIGIKL